MSSMNLTKKQVNKSSIKNSSFTNGSNALKVSAMKKPDPMDIIQRLHTNPELITKSDMLYLQSVIGNQKVSKLLSDVKKREDSKKNKNVLKPEVLDVPKENKNNSSEKDFKDETIKLKRINTQFTKEARAEGSKKSNNISSEDIITKPQKTESNEKQGIKKDEGNINATQNNKGLGDRVESKGDDKAGSDVEGEVESKSGSNNGVAVEAERGSNVEGKGESKTGSKVEGKGGNIAKGNMGKNSKSIEKNAVLPVVSESNSSVPEIEKKDEEIKTENEHESYSKSISGANGEGNKGGASVSGKAGPPLMQKGPKASSKPLKVKIKSENPEGIISQLEDTPPAAIFDAYTQAVSASSDALKNQRQNTQQMLSEVSAPTGLEPVEKAGKVGKAIEPLKHNMPQEFRSQKTGGNVHEGIPGEIKDTQKGDEIDPEQIMKQARNQAAAAPKIGMTGEADPSQIDGFKAEASQSVKAAKEAELSQVNKDFGENNIYPKTDNTTLKADTKIKEITPPNAEAMQTINISQDIADRINQPLSLTLKNQIGSKKNEYQKGKVKFDSDVVAAKADTDKQIKEQKAEAKEKQLNEQNKVKSEVEGLRGEWRSEINVAVAEYDQKADAASKEKSSEIGSIKTQKEGEVQKELDKADKEAQKEYIAAKTEADKKKKEGEKDDKNFLEQGWDWVKDKAQKVIDSVKKAVNFVFEGLKKAVKYIFDKAKEAAKSIIEAGRKLIVGLIKKLGDFLKGLVKKVFARFPEFAKKICSKIDNVINKAITLVNKAADLLKKGVTAALNFLGKTLDSLFGAIQSLYNGIVSSIGKLLKGGFKDLFFKVLEGAQIAAEIALAFATGGGSILVQVAMWLANTLPKLMKTVSSVLGFVDTIRNFNIEDIKQLLKPAKVGEFLVKGLFGELSPLSQMAGDKDKKKSSGGGGKTSGLIKVFNALSGVFKMLKGVYNKVTGAINKVLPVINISSKPWFDMFSMVYAGAVKAMEFIQNPAEALSEGVGKLKGAILEFFGNIKSKVVETAGSIKEKLTVIGNPAKLMKLIANKAVDMVLNFIIMNPPSALLKAVFKAISAVSGKSLVQLVREHIPFADKLINKIAESGPVSRLLKPLQGPVNRVGGMIDQVSGKTVSVVEDSKQKSVGLFGSGAKVLKDIAGYVPGSKKESKSVGAKSGGILGVLKSGIHTRLLAFGKKILEKGKAFGKKILDKGKGALNKSVGKIKGMIIGSKVSFKIGKEKHKMWLEKQGNKNVLMMASNNPGRVKEKTNLDSKHAKEIKLAEKVKNAEQTGDSTKVSSIADAVSKMETAGVDEGTVKIPTVRNGEFRDWFNSISVEEFNKLWKIPETREIIEDRLRSPGGLHEWHMVSRAPKFKSWGITAQQIAEMRTPTSRVEFKNPTGVHGGEGSTTAHNEILKIIDSANNYESFVTGLQDWADNRLEGGASALPGALKR